jgi:alkaline phosphatase D
MKKVFLTLITVALAYATQAQKQDFFRQKNLAELYPFYHGVASGDPLGDRVMLWTRVTDDTLSVDSVAVEWRIATDTSMINVINSGIGYAAASRDWTMKIDATGLQPNTWYYYDFKTFDKYSLRGRTKTAPVGDVDSIRFGVASCSNYEHGYFSPYRHLKDRNDIDYILHLGDYIYEYEVGGFSANISGRSNEPTNEVITLEDYRLRHSHYKLDNDLRLLHQQYPFINIWDDHESANDSYKDGAGNHDPATEGPWIDRKNNSAQAYHEWLPIRSPQPGTGRIYRAFEFGDLINLPMVDTRIEARDEQGGAAETNDPARTLLGATQYTWLTNNLSSSTKQWNILGNQVMIAPLELVGTPLNYDQWDGYNYEREQLLNYVVNNNVNNFVVLTGDIHTSWVNNIPMSNYDNSNCTGSAGVEFVVTSVTSTSFISFNIPSFLITSSNPHNQYFNTAERGYGILDVNKQRTQFDFYYMDDIEDPNSGQYFAEGYFVNNNEKCANQASGFSVNPGPLPIPAPASPLVSVGIEELNYQDFVVFGAYPNPAFEDVTFQIFMENAGDLNIAIYDIQGKEIYNENMTNLNKGLNYAKLNISTLAVGTYSFVIKSDSNVANKTIVKSN